MKKILLILFYLPFSLIAQEKEIKSDNYFDNLTLEEREIIVKKGARSVNGKSIMGVLTLAAATGTDLTIEADGTDEKQALDAVIKLISNRFGEDE